MPGHTNDDIFMIYHNFKNKKKIPFFFFFLSFYYYFFLPLKPYYGIKSCYLYCTVCVYMEFAKKIMDGFLDDNLLGSLDLE